MSTPPRSMRKSSRTLLRSSPFRIRRKPTGKQSKLEAQFRRCCEHLVKNRPGRSSRGLGSALTALLEPIAAGEATCLVEDAIGIRVGEQPRVRLQLVDPTLKRVVDRLNGLRVSGGGRKGPELVDLVLVHGDDRLLGERADLCRIHPARELLPRLITDLERPCRADLIASGDVLVLGQRVRNGRGGQPLGERLPGPAVAVAVVVASAAAGREKDARADGECEQPKRPAPDLTVCASALHGS